MTLTAKDVAEITKLLEESSFDELYLELDGVKLSLRRAGAGSAAPPAQSTGQVAPATARASGVPTGPAPVAEAPSGAGGRGGDAVPAAAGISPATRPSSPAAALSPPAAISPAAGTVDAHDVPAPLLGTFYRAPKPGAPPFIEIGARVEEETIIGIIEVMKLMNTVRAGVRGCVVEILARDGALVEYGETLLRVGKSD